MTRPRILFLDILSDNKDLRKDLNSKVHKIGYAETMRRAFGVPKSRWITVDAPFDPLPTNLDLFDGLVIGGSIHDAVTGHETDWMKKVYRFIRKAAKIGIPILGICGGMQFTAKALGGEVTFNPRGRTLGSKKVDLTESGVNDPLFKELPRSFSVLLSHKCMVGKSLTSWNLLADSKTCDVQAIAIGKNIRLVQFHPEMNDKDVKGIARLIKSRLFAEGFVKREEEFVQLVDGIEDTSAIGRRIIQNFLGNFVDSEN